MPRTLPAALRSTPVRVAILVVAFLALLVAAGWLSVWSGLDEFVALPSRTLRVLWLPLILVLGLLVLAMIWGLWRLTSEERRTSQYPDIDWAWEEIRLGLRKAGVDLDGVPLFLVLGQPANGTDSLFRAARASLVAANLPRRPNAPIKVFATSEAIFIACPEISILARLSGELDNHGDRADRPEPPDGAGSPPTTGTPEPAGPSIAADPPSPAGMASRGSSPDATLLGILDPPATQSGPSATSRPGILSRSAEVSILEERLQHLCGLIVRARRPYCPINGIVGLIPYAAAGDDSQARQAGTALHLDLTAARKALGVSCPFLSVVCDLDQASQARRLIRAYAADPRYNVLGRSLPLIPELDVPGRVELVENGMEWICQGLIAPLLYRLIQVETSDQDDGKKILDSNHELFRLLSDTHPRWNRVARILGRVIALDPGGDLMLGGCYLAATGPSESEQGFGAGIIRTLLEHQNYVAWLPDALRQDRNDQRRAILYNLGSIAAAAAIAVLLYLLWSSRP